MRPADLHRGGAACDNSKPNPVVCLKTLAAPTALKTRRLERPGITRPLLTAAEKRISPISGSFWRGDASARQHPATAINRHKNVKAANLVTSSRERTAAVAIFSPTQQALLMCSSEVAIFAY